MDTVHPWPLRLPRLCFLSLGAGPKGTGGATSVLKSGPISNAMVAMCGASETVVTEHGSGCARAVRVRACVSAPLV